MTPTDQSARFPSLVARIDERLLAPMRRHPRARQWFVATIVAALALHGALLALLLHRESSASQLVAKQEPPAVEVIVEKPQPKPEPAKPPPPPPPKPAAKQEIEKPASSAPRAPSEEKVETAALQKETHAPKAASPPKDGKPEPAEATAKPDPAEPDKTPEKSEEAAAKPDVLQKDAEALDKAKPQPKKLPDKKVAKLPPKPKVRRAKTALEQLAGASPLPDYTFARPTKKSPVYGGSEDSRYLAIVYGMIMRHRARVTVPGGDGGNVTIAFNVDEEGNLTGVGIQQTSGYPAIDAAAVSAIRRASPFPPPPPGAPHGLIATIGFGEGEPVYTMGSRDR